MKKCFKVSSVSFRENFSECLNRASYSGSDCAITRRKRIIAVVVSYEDYLEYLSLKNEEIQSIDSMETYKQV